MLKLVLTALGEGHGPNSSHIPLYEDGMIGGLPNPLPRGGCFGCKFRHFGLACALQHILVETLLFTWVFARDARTVRTSFDELPDRIFSLVTKPVLNRMYVTTAGLEHGDSRVRRANMSKYKSKAIALRKTVTVD